MEATGINRWADRNSFKYFLVPSTCCASEWLQTVACRYDLERFGCVEVNAPIEADLLVVQGFISEKLAPEIKAIYDQMPEPKKVLAIGACAARGGSFFEKGIAADQVIHVDVWAAGCPPRPEAIMSAILSLKDGGNQK